MTSSDEFRRKHLERIYEATLRLYKQEDSICKQCHYEIPLQLYGDGELSCLFCYCPEYFYPNCGGSYRILNNGVKDCSGCVRPHTKEFVMKYLERFYYEDV